MRKYDTSAITTTIAAPVKGGTFVHLQLAYQEALDAIAKAVIGPFPQANKVYVLFGCVNTGTYPTYTISAGAVYYNGEVYLVDAVTFTTSGGHVAVASIATTYFTDQSADPVTFKDTSTHNMHQIRKIVLADGLSGSTIADFSAFLHTQLVLANEQQATLGASYIVKFDKDKAVFFASATVNTTLNFDFTNAIPGAVVRLKWTWGAGLNLSISGVGNYYQEGGDITRCAGHTNTMYLTYLGKNESGNDEVGYSISQVV